MNNSRSMIIQGAGLLVAIAYRHGVGAVGLGNKHNNPKFPVVSVSANPVQIGVGLSQMTITFSDPVSMEPAPVTITSAIEEMTSMNMGQTTLKIEWVKPGVGTFAVSPSMAGPWRVVLTAVCRDKTAQVVIPFSAGEGKKFDPKLVRVTEKIRGDQGQRDEPMPGMADMNGYKLEPIIPTRIIKAGSMSSNSVGFGKNAPMVAMMNQMMVEGSGMEGMKMVPMRMDFGAQNYASGSALRATGATLGGGEWKVESKTPFPKGMKVAVISHRAGPDGGVLITLQFKQEGASFTPKDLTAKLAMVTMNMGTSSPKIQARPDGSVDVTAFPSMAGQWKIEFSFTGPDGAVTTFDLAFDHQ